MRILIVDDESKARGLLCSLIAEKYGSQMELQEASTLTTALEKIKSFKPHLLLLDINLKNHSGFDLLDHLDTRNFELIFTTAYSEFALKAFQYSAIHYLLKPINVAELESAIDRVIAKQHTGREEDLSESNSKNEKITLPSLKGDEYLKVNEIILCEANGAYTSLYLRNGKNKLISKSLGWFEDRLSSADFCRTHKKYIVNLNAVESVTKGKTAILNLHNNLEAGVSQTYKKEVLERLEKQ